MGATVSTRDKIGDTEATWPVKFALLARGHRPATDTGFPTKRTAFFIKVYILNEQYLRVLTVVLVLNTQFFTSIS